MNKIIISLLFLVIFGAIFFFLVQNKNKSGQPTSTASPPAAPKSKYTNAESISVNNQKSNVVWSAKKVIGSSNHTGTINIQEGEILVSKNQISGGEFTIAMNSIQNTQTGAGEKLVGHLKSADFFDVAQFPDSKMIITKIEKMNGSDNKFSVTGNLTIKGKTNQITFPATIERTDGEIIADAEFSIDRTKWGITFGSGSFFDNLGDGAIDDLIGYKIHLET